MPKSTEYRLNVRLDRTLVDTIRTVADLGPRELSDWVIEAMEEKLARIQQAEIDERTAEIRERMDRHKRFLAATGGPYLVDADNDRHYGRSR